MAAQELAAAGLHVRLFDAKPSIGRKFLMAGKSGLNLTKSEDIAPFLTAYSEATDWLTPIVSAFGPEAVQAWASGLGQPLFTGSTGRVFPKAMKASPLLRAWLAHLAQLDVQTNLRWRWRGWDGADLQFDTPQGPTTITADVTVLALGGGSWARLGSDGEWTLVLAAAGADIAPFQPANAAVSIAWSPYMTRHFGAPLKGVAFHAAGQISRGEATLSATGIEGGGVYTLSPALRNGATLTLDLAPDLSVEAVTARLEKPRGKTSLTNHLRKTLGIQGPKLALLQECARPLPSAPAQLAAVIKSLPIPVAGLAPLDTAISTAGGVGQSALTADLMLQAKPGVFCAGEMLDWEAPTGGYLITACLATGRWAGRGAARWAGAEPAPA